MDKLDFKLKYYFEEFKDKPFKNSREFRQAFRNKYGEFKYLSELTVMIYNYQAKKYGGRLCNCYLLSTREERKKASVNDRQRKRNRLGK